MIIVSHKSCVLLTFSTFRKFVAAQKEAFTSLQAQVFKDKQAVYWYVTCF